MHPLIVAVSFLVAFLCAIGSGIWLFIISFKIIRNYIRDRNLPRSYIKLIVFLVLFISSTVVTILASRTMSQWNGP
jgi:succinate dehydrogenase/fumarate reductase cytochrome b subunit